MFVDHKWETPPYTKPGGSIYKNDGSIYWLITKEPERADRYYKWFKQDIMATAYGFDTECCIKAAFFKNALTCYLIRVLHVNKKLDPIQSRGARIK